MLSSRPLLYLSLPGLALILGVFWYRRRNNFCKSKSKNGDEVESKANSSLPNNSPQLKNDKPEVMLNLKISNQPSNSLKINDSVIIDENNSATKKFEKSSPIKIVQTANRVSPINTLKPISQESDTLQSNVGDTKHKTLEAIIDLENLSSVNLPDSVNHRISFCSRNVNCKKDQPVIIKATNTPKISPENLFFESKYVNHSEQNNHAANDDLLSSQRKITSHKKTIQESNASQRKIDISTVLNKISDSDFGSIEVSSPSMSLHSLQSGESGGSSLRHSEATRAKVTYEFLYPVGLLGYLQGRHRPFVSKIKMKTNAEVSLRRYPYSTKVRVCVIEGNEAEVGAALAMIRQRLPAKQYPNFTMQRIHYALPHTIVPLSTQSLLSLQLNLIENINNDVVVSTVISGNQLFVQHPLHPTYPSLDVLQKCLYESYTKAESPFLPCLQISAVCVLQINSKWYRVQIIAQNPNDDLQCVVKLLDFGGYTNAHFNELRQIRSDFMGLPFQATECILSNIVPTEKDWNAETAETLCKLTRGIVLQAQVAGYNSQNIPEIYLFACLSPNNIVFINKELVARNLANWVDLRE